MRGPDVEMAVDHLADAVSHALRGKAGKDSSGGRHEEFSLRSNRLGQNDGTDTRLAALRVLGADALAPFVLAGYPFGREDADLVKQAVRAYPAPEPESDTSAALWRLRDWALACVLRSLTAGRALPVPEHAPVRPDGQRREMDWQSWSVELMRLSSLALPGIPSSPREEASARRQDLASGLTRAILRRDFLGAARLARWQALDYDPQREDPHALDTILDHLTLLAGDRPRVLLETTLARLLLDGSRR